MEWNSFKLLQLVSLYNSAIIGNFYRTNTVVRCPSDMESWFEKAENLSCSGEVSYHCLRTTNYSRPFMELCATRSMLNSADGCPVLQPSIYEYAWVPAVQQFACVPRDGVCPDNSKEEYFWSDELYKDLKKSCL